MANSWLKMQFIDENVIFGRKKSRNLWKMSLNSEEKLNLKRQLKVSANPLCLLAENWSKIKSLGVMAPDPELLELNRHCAWLFSV